MRRLGVISLMVPYDEGMIGFRRGIRARYLYTAITRLSCDSITDTTDTTDGQLALRGVSPSSLAPHLVSSVTPERTRRLLCSDFRSVFLKFAMPNVHCQQVGTSPAQAEALLAGVLAAVNAALPHQGLDLLVWGAARLGDQATLRYLLANGGEPSWRPLPAVELWGGKCCLWAASRNGHEGAVKELIEHGADVDRVQGGEKHLGSTPLCVAAEEGHEGVVEQLLKAGADVSKASTNLRYGASPPLCVAAQHGHEGVVDQLLEAGANVKVTSGGGHPPLCIAAHNGHEGVVERLLKAEADVNKATSVSGATPLYFAAGSGHEGVVEQLLKAGAGVENFLACNRATPLCIAAEEGHEGVVEQLLKAGANPDAETQTRRHFRRTPLSMASSNGHSRVCSLLLEAGAKVNHSPSYGEHPLMNAVSSGNREVALVLMEHGASTSDRAFTQPLLQELNKWMAEALKENKRQMEQMVQAIPEWCAQAASSVAAEQGNGADPPQPDASVGSKRKAPPAGD